MRFFFLGLVVMAPLQLAPAVLMADTANDTITARSVADRLKSSGQMQKYHLGVKCDNGTTWLVGTVTDAEQQQTAIKLAQATPGVSRVINRLTIQNGQVARATIEQPQSQQRPQGKASHASLDEPAYEGPAFEISSPVTSEPAVPTAEDNRFTQQPRLAARSNRPLAIARRPDAMHAVSGQPIPAHAPTPSGVAPARFDQPQMPGYAWPSYAAYPNYAAVTYPKQYSPTAWPFIGPFYPYPQVPLGWRKVTLEWDDGWWQLDFKER